MEKQPKKRRSMRCPLCKSLSTKKNGTRKLLSIGYDRKTIKEVQRYQCKNCGKTFSKRRDSHKHYSSGFVDEIIRKHIEERMSFRVISKRLYEELGVRISPSYLCRLLNERIKKVKSSKQIKEEYSPEWSGHLIVDDKMINIKGDKKVSLIAKDKDGDIVHEELLDYPDQESYDNFIRFITERLDYNFISITTDLDTKLVRSIERGLSARIPHQLCLKHSLDNIYRMISYQRIKSKLNKLERESEIDGKRFSAERRGEIIKLKSKMKELDLLVKMIKKYLWQSSKAKSEQIFDNLKRDYGSKYPGVIEFLFLKKRGLLAHQKDKNIPKTNNDAENTNKQIKRRFKTIEAFQSEENAYNYLILYCNYLRMKPYTDCRKLRKYRNGYSPLQLSNVQLNTYDWVKFSLNFN